MKTKMMATRVMLVAAMIACSGYVTAGRAQMGAASKTAPGAMVDPAKSFDAMLTGFEGEMMGLAKAMPADKYDFAPSAGVFASSQKTEFSGVRSFGADGAPYR